MAKRMLFLLAGASLMAFLDVTPGEVAARTAPHGAATLPHHSISHHRHSARHAPKRVAVLGELRGATELTNKQMDKITAGGSFTKDLTSTSSNTFNSSGNLQIANSIQGGVGINSRVKGNSASLTFDNQAVGKNASVQGSLSQLTAAGQGSAQTGQFASAAGNSASLAFDNQALGKNTSVQGSFSQVAVAGQGSSLTGLFVSAANR
ncbi:MAG: hypothetical protein WA633_15940 [Stellaceae bacterium]